MPPSSPAQRPVDTSHLLAEHNQQKNSTGAVIGAIIIILVLAFGALYFYGDYLNRHNAQEPLPFIPGDPA